MYVLSLRCYLRLLIGLFPRRATFQVANFGRLSLCTRDLCITGIDLLLSSAG